MSTAAAARSRRIEGPKSRQGRFGFLDPDDPDFENVVREHAKRTGQDPDRLIRDEVAARNRGRSLDDVVDQRVDEQLKARRAGQRRGPGRAGTTQGKGAGGSSRASSRRRPASGPSLIPTPTLTPRADLGDGAGLLFALILVAMFNNYVNYGPAGIRAWFKAKFLNIPNDGLVPTAAPAPARPGPGAGATITPMSAGSAPPVAPTPPPPGPLVVSV